MEIRPHRLKQNRPILARKGKDAFDAIELITLRHCEQIEEKAGNRFSDRFPPDRDNRNAPIVPRLCRRVDSARPERRTIRHLIGG